MILVLSQTQLAVTVEDVMDWLHYFGADYKRLNGQDFLDDFTITNEGIYYKDLNTEDVNVVWFRRWSDEPNFLNNNEEKLDGFGLSNIGSLASNVSFERAKASQYFFSQLKHAYWTTIPKHISANKIEVLQVALESGLRVPEFIITSKKSELEKFVNKHQKIITKPVSEVASFFIESEDSTERSIVLTSVLTAEDIDDSIPDRFHFTLFQECIEKEYEIRTFFLDGQFYSMAIFSQIDEQTTTDFRDYNFKNPNRNVPYQLPENVEKKLLKFIEKTNYQIGSFDLIKSKDGEYVFLEINPVGQFGMVSLPCNYYLEKKLANYLKDEDQKISGETQR